jgi:hypothetical protein
MVSVIPRFIENGYLGAPDNLMDSIFITTLSRLILLRNRAIGSN